MRLSRVLSVFGASCIGVGVAQATVADARCRERLEQIRASGGQVRWLNIVDNMDEDEQRSYMAVPASLPSD